MGVPSTGATAGTAARRERLGAPITRKLLAVVAGSSGRVSRIAAHPVGASVCLALAYMVLCGAYVVLSGLVAAHAAESIDELRRLERLKGLLFIIVTGAAYFWFAAHLLKRIAVQQQHLALIFHGISDGLFLLRVDADDTFRFLCANAAFIKLSGAMPTPVAGDGRDTVLPAPFQAELHSRCRQALRERKSQRWDSRAAYPEGQRLGEITLTPLADRTGTLVQLAGVVHDITERRQAEDEVRQLSGHLMRSQDEERLRIGRELHDGTGQELAAVAMNLGLVQQRSAGRDVTADNLLADSQAIMEHCQRELRTLSYRLHPPLLDEGGLAGAVQAYADGFTQRSGIAVTLDARLARGRFPSDTEWALFRVMQESLGNIHRHSGSRTAAIRIVREGADVVLEVRDQGHGLELRTDGKVAKMGVGLAGMRERVRQLGGLLEVETSDHGTTVRASVPGAMGAAGDYADSDCR